MVEPASMVARISPCKVAASRVLTGFALVRPPRSLMPRTAVLPAPPSPAFALVGVLVLLAATDIGFVNFDRAAQRLYVVATGFAQTAQHEPR